MKAKGISVLLLVALFLGACSPSEVGTPTPDVDQIYTAAAQTVIAELTQTAAVTTATSAATATPTSTAGTATAVPTSSVATEPVLPTATIQPSVVVEAAPTDEFCDDAVFVTDVSVQDGTEMSPGQNFEKTWRVENSGTCSWGEDYKVVYGYGAEMNGQARAVGRAVAPGETVDVTVVFAAPLEAGNYESYWRMANTKGVNFGTFLSVVIVVR